MTFVRWNIFAVLLWLGFQSSTADEQMEKTMMRSLRNCPLCAEHEPCLLDCRYGQKRAWKVCLEECLATSPLVRDMIIKLSVPEEPEDKAHEQPAPNMRGSRGNASERTEINKAVGGHVAEV